MHAKIGTARTWDPASEYRAKATLGVALVALGLLLPISIWDFVADRTAIGIGSICIVLFLLVNASLVIVGRCHQKLTLYGLVPAGMTFMIGVFQDDAFIGSLWCYPSIVACYCMLSAKRATIANITILTISIPMILTTLPPVYAYRVCATLLAISLFANILVRVIDKQQHRLHELLIHDSLTGLLNRFTLGTTLCSAIERCKSQGTRSSILAIDIDHFKSINDRYGHDVGDQVLHDVSQLFLRNLRESDAAFRSGGEEFLILLHDSDLREAKNIAQRLRHVIELAPIVPNQSLTVSIGIARCESSEDWTSWMKRADESLYEAKNQGRNRVVVSAHAGQSQLHFAEHASNL
jgi:diguanylate cyclase (GGDEF)-like protein